MDQLSTQWQATKNLTAQGDSVDSLEFTVPNLPNPVWALVDTPHLFKNIRTCLLSNDIQVLIHF